MIDETESYRRVRQAQLNQLGLNFSQDEIKLLEGLLQVYGEVWNTESLGEEFEVMGLMAPFVVVKRKADGVKGSLEFINSPKLYFHWVEDKK